MASFLSSPQGQFPHLQPFLQSVSPCRQPSSLLFTTNTWLRPSCHHWPLYRHKYQLPPSPSTLTRPVLQADNLSLAVPSTPTHSAPPFLLRINSSVGTPPTVLKPLPTLILFCLQAFQTLFFQQSVLIMPPTRSPPTAQASCDSRSSATSTTSPRWTGCQCPGLCCAHLLANTREPVLVIRSRPGLPASMLATLSTRPSGMGITSGCVCAEPLPRGMALASATLYVCPYLFSTS